MKRYEEDMKTKALARAQEIGVKKTGEELGISIQTLYKWRNDQKSALKFPEGTPGALKRNGEVLAILKEDKTLEKKIQLLEAENAELRMSVMRLRKALMAMVE